MKKNIGWIIPIIIVLIIGISLGLSSGDKDDDTEKVKLMSGKYNVVINIKDYGEISLELDADVAPITVTNFINLVNKGFYDGKTFHRIIDGFMIQGGAPNASDSVQSIIGEFASNGIENSISHKRGTISMARTKVLNSASSQFFIVHEDSTYLDGQYAGFGHVTSGMEVVDKIAEDSRPVDDNGTILKEEQPIIESIKVID